jgi:hypothetical protein
MMPDQPLTAADLEAIEARSARLRRRIRAVVALPSEKVMPDTLGVAGDSQAVDDVVQVIQDVPRLVAEVRRLRAELTQAGHLAASDERPRRARPRRPKA